MNDMELLQNTDFSLINKSIDEKISKVYHLATILGYHKNSKEKKIWDMIDFGYGREFNILDGKCSLKKRIEFSMEEWEHQIDEDLKYFENLNNNITECNS